MGKLAITGVNGFPGRAVLAWADRAIVQGSASGLGAKYSGIVAIDILPPIDTLQKTVFHNVDLTDHSADLRLAEIFADEGVEAVLHLAFHFNPRKQSQESHELHSIGTMHLLNACARQNVKKIVVGSTTYCYGAFPTNPNFLPESFPLRGGQLSSYIRDRVDVEKQFTEYQKEKPQCVVTILRPCSVLGPNVENFATRYLSRPVCLTPLGFDPLIQVVHEEDVLRAFQLALEKDVRGPFNIVGRGVLPLLTALRISGRVALPVASFMLYPMVQALWMSNLAIVPPGFLDFLHYLWVADGGKAKNELGFEPTYSTRETILSFIARQRLRNVHLTE